MFSSSNQSLIHHVKLNKNIQGKNTSFVCIGPLLGAMWKGVRMNPLFHFVSIYKPAVFFFSRFFFNGGLIRHINVNFLNMS